MCGIPFYDPSRPVRYCGGPRRSEWRFQFCEQRLQHLHWHHRFDPGVEGNRRCGTGGVSGNGSYNVNTDDAGSLTATDGRNLGMVFATNGTLIRGVDFTNGTQPQLYIFVEQEIPQ
jgi:hypothetical protein